MPILHIAILALVQGITEFLPISSSGHLVLVPTLLAWPDQGLGIDVAVHVGTLGAVLLYFWRDTAALATGFWRTLKGNGRRDPGARLLYLLAVASVPVFVAGVLIDAYLEPLLRNLEIIGWTMLGFGIVLWISDRIGLTVRRIEHLGLGDAILIGLAQALALIPGTSRAGITMSAARILGIERSEAARFSMLLSIPAIIGAGTLKGIDLYRAHDAVMLADSIMAAVMALLAALVAIGLLMAWLKRATFTPFVIYRILLGGGLLALSYGWFA